VVATGYQFGRCLASQMGQSFLYDCEYFGSVDRLVLTPLTERVFLSLTSAVKSFRCGVLTGTASVGKCQTVADLAVVGLYLLRFFSVCSFMLDSAFCCFDAVEWILGLKEVICSKFSGILL